MDDEENEEERQTMKDLSDLELQKEIEGLIGATPRADEKFNAHTFLTKVAEADDTTKVGNLTETEIGMLPSTQRSYKELALICGTIMDNDYFKKYFEKEAEILTSTSLSKNAKLIELAVVQRREFSKDSGYTIRKENRGWFKPKRKYPVSEY